MTITSKSLFFAVFFLFLFILMTSGCSKGEGLLSQLRGGIGGDDGGNGGNGGNGSGDLPGVVKKIGALGGGGAAGNFSTATYKFASITFGGPVHETRSSSASFSVKGGLDAR